MATRVNNLRMQPLQEPWIVEIEAHPSEEHVTAVDKKATGPENA